MLARVPIADILNRQPSALKKACPPAPDWSKRIPSLDGLRGIAILLVLLEHGVVRMHPESKFFSAVLSGGMLAWSGVDLFFVLSGFLIGGILLDVKESPKYFKTFYIRRAYRILPLYGVLTGLFFFRHLPFTVLSGRLGEHSAMAIPWYAYVTMTQNWWTACIGSNGPRAMIVTWSLAVEEQFYLTIPLLIRRLKPDWLIPILAGIVVCAPLLRAFLYSHLAHGPLACYVLTPCRADALCLGVLSAYLVRQKRGWAWLHTHRRMLYMVTAILSAGVVFMTYEHCEQLSSFMATLGYSWLTFFYAGCLLLVVSGGPGCVNSLLCSSWLMRLGTLAYCTYLAHVPLIEGARRLLELHFGKLSPLLWLAGGIAGITATLMLATCSWKFFERPLLRRGHTYQY